MSRRPVPPTPDRRAALIEALLDEARQLLRKVRAARATSWELRNELTGRDPPHGRA